MAVGDRIRALRKRVGLSMKQLAEKVGVGYLTIYRIETGTVSPSVALWISQNDNDPCQTLFLAFLRASPLSVL